MTRNFLKQLSLITHHCHKETHNGATSWQSLGVKLIGRCISLVAERFDLVHQIVKGKPNKYWEISTIKMIFNCGLLKHFSENN